MRSQHLVYEWQDRTQRVSLAFGPVDKEGVLRAHVSRETLSFLRDASLERVVCLVSWMDGAQVHLVSTVELRFLKSAVRVVDGGLDIIVPHGMRSHYTSMMRIRGAIAELLLQS